MRLFKRIVFISVILSGIGSSCPGQSHIDEELTLLFTPKDTVKQDFTYPLRTAQNDISTLVSLGFLFYKTFISSQDTPSCVFTPSCSEYAVLSVQKKGLIVGWLNTFDRLSRCHGLVNHHHYSFDAEHQRYHDPVH